MLFRALARVIFMYFLKWTLYLTR